MNKGVNKKLLSTLIILLLVFAMIISIVALTACNKDTDNDDSDGSTTPTDTSKKDKGHIKNGTFEFMAYEDSDANYPAVPRNWNYKSDPDSSSSSSYLLKGIMDINEDAYNANKDNFPKDSDGNPISLSSIVQADKDGVEDTDVLMIYNKEFTAGRYTSDSFSINQNSYAKISIDVLTLIDSKSSEGAHINLIGDFENSERISMKNIDTAGQWKTYTFYIKGSSLKTSYLNIELGLGNKNTVDSGATVKGAVFFDNITFDFLYMKEYDEAMEGLEDGNRDQLTGNKFKATGNKFQAMGQVNDDIEKDMALASGSDIQKTTIAYDFTKYQGEALNGQDYSELDISLFDLNGYYYSNGMKDFTDDSEVSGSKYGITTVGNAKTFLGEEKDMLETIPFSSDNSYKLIQMSTPKGTKATATLTATQPFDIKEARAYKISMWVKTGNMKRGTGLNIHLFTFENDAKKILETFTLIDTSVSNMDLAKNDDGIIINEDYINVRTENWINYSFFVKGSNLKDTAVYLEYNFGPNASEQDIKLDNPAKEDYPTGNAFIANISIEKIFQSEYSSASSGSAVKVVELTQASASSVTNGDFNITFNSDVEFNKDPWENNPLYAASWGVYPSGANAVGGDASNNTVTFPSANQFSYGIVHYYSTPNLSDHVTKPKIGLPTLYQMYNIEPVSLGLVSSALSMPYNSSNIKDGTYYRVSLNIFVGNGAKANIYLVDSETKQVLKVPNGDVLGTDDAAFENISSTTDMGTLFAPVDTAGITELELGNGWREYIFFVKTGALSKNFTLEVWNGSRSGTDNSQGYVFFDNVNIIQIGKEHYEAALDKAETDGNKLLKFLDYSALDLEEAAETPPESIETPSDGKNFDWTMFSVLFVSILMIVALLLIFVRMAIKNGYFKRTPKAEQVYDGEKYYKADETEKKEKTDSSKE